MINTTILRENQEYPLGAHLQNEIADELDRLYLDTAPLSREELEDELRKAGCTLSFDYPTKTKYSSANGETWIYLDQNNRIEILGDVVFKGPLSAVCRRLLRDCGVIALDPQTAERQEMSRATAILFAFSPRDYCHFLNLRLNAAGGFGGLSKVRQMKDAERFEKVFDKLFEREQRIDWTLFTEFDRESGFRTYCIDTHVLEKPIIRGCDTPLDAFETALEL